MASYRLGKGWLPLLMEAAENVRSRVRKALLKRSSLGLIEMKGLLDSEAQEAISETLISAGVSVNVISEEGDYSLGEGGPYLIVDPVDGTTNLARGIPLAVTSLALSETQWLSGATMGIILDLYTGDVYRAERNLGAWRGGLRINTAKPRSVKGALISLDISKGAPIDPVRALIHEAGHLRQLGCTALALCHIASGLIDAHVDLRGSLRATDVAAGLVILKEAGGIRILNGSLNGDLELSKESTLSLVATSGPGMMEDILKLLK
jgi:myo-inositol-1(or 4)-monophosphatase